MRPQRYTITSGNSPRIILVDWASSEDLAIQAVPDTTETYTVEITIDDVHGGVTPHWVQVTDMIATNDTQIKSINDGVSGVRITLDTGTSVDITLAQPTRT
jgi:hypothetical protein